VTPSSSIRFLAAFLAAFALGACTQPPPATATYAPSVGQPGKDVVWVPTPSVLVDTMLDMAKVTRDDFVIDLGSGDGRTVIAAAMRGARALGIEYEGEMVALSRRNARQAGVADRATFVQQDLFESDFSKATVVTMFLLPDINRKLMPRLLSLKPGTRIVSNSFPIGDWTPDQSVILTAEMGCETAWCTAMSWVVPARVVGTHATPHGELSLDQSFQMLSGTLKTANATVPVEGRVVGEEVVLKAGERELRGRVIAGRVTIP
jgi:hypothetical protein